MTDAAKILGCLLGGAVGDAFGSPHEGKKFGQVEIKDDARWEFSDDTQLTFATCEAIIQSSGEVEPEVVAARFAAWHKDSRVTGMGASTYKALSELAHGGHWALVGSKGERAAGSGAAMRVAPLAFCLNPEDEAARRTIRDVCRITHHNEEAYVGALAVVHSVRAAWAGDWDGGSNLLEFVKGLLPDSRVRDRIASLSEIEPTLSAAEVGRRFGSSGYVVDSVPLALFGARQCVKLGFKRMLHGLVLAGGDTDTVASIAGQAAGTLVGVDAVPPEMLARLPKSVDCERIARQFAATIASTRGQ
jgi:ADP-ribosylglycohydrolase